MHGIGRRKDATTKDLCHVFSLAQRPAGPLHDAVFSLLLSPLLLQTRGYLLCLNVDLSSLSKLIHLSGGFLPLTDLAGFTSNYIQWCKTISREHFTIDGTDKGADDCGNVAGKSKCVLRSGQSSKEGPDSLLPRTYHTDR
ncbi:hypothetical protein J6590_019686 [Homalodisca vitripennis]|nr:hypothetical protein J6590_019686 [Homalodisca vitripennis]